MSEKIKLTPELIAEALTYGSKWKHEKVAWLTKSEAIEAIKYSHGVTELTPSTTPKTTSIFDLKAPYANEYQGKARKVVFVCMVGILRSPTAAGLASIRGINARAVGIDEKALIQLNANLVQWANQIVFFGHSVKHACISTFPELADMEHKHVVWPIPDNYDYNDPILCNIINGYLDELEKMSLYGG